jgi:hypothetical protein
MILYAYVDSKKCDRSIELQCDRTFALSPLPRD